MKIYTYARLHHERAWFPLFCLQLLLQNRLQLLRGAAQQLRVQAVLQQQRRLRLGDRPVVACKVRLCDGREVKQLRLSNLTQQMRAVGERKAGS